MPCVAISMRSMRVPGGRNTSWERPSRYAAYWASPIASAASCVACARADTVSAATPCCIAPKSLNESSPRSGSSSTSLERSVAFCSRTLRVIIRRTICDVTPAIDQIQHALTALNLNDVAFDRDAREDWPQSTRGRCGAESLRIGSWTRLSAWAEIAGSLICVKAHRRKQIVCKGQ
ncbi:hypothetical protein PSAC2689_10673 [Paraburkholderia sacchari]